MTGKPRGGEASGLVDPTTSWPFQEPTSFLFLCSLVCGVQWFCTKTGSCPSWRRTVYHNWGIQTFPFTSSRRQKVHLLPHLPKISEVHSDWPVPWEIECADWLPPARVHSWTRCEASVCNTHGPCGEGMNIWMGGLLGLWPEQLEGWGTFDWNGKCTGRNRFEEGGQV